MLVDCKAEANVPHTKKVCILLYETKPMLVLSKSNVEYRMISGLSFLCICHLIYYC